MKAIILAAGRGSRMGSLTEDAPKCLAPLGGRPLLDWQMSALGKAGITTIGAVCGYRKETLEGRGLVLFENAEWAQTNMVASLACAAEWLRNEPVIVSYSDIFYPPVGVAALIDADAELAMAYDPHWLGLWSRRSDDPLSDAETFRLDGTRVVEIGKRAERLDEIEGQYTGLLKFTPESWRAVEAFCATLPEERARKLDMTSLLSGLIAAGVNVTATPIGGVWGEADNGTDLALYERMLADGEIPRY